MGTGASSARDGALITFRRTTVVHAWWVPGQRLLNRPWSRRTPGGHFLLPDGLAQEPLLGPISSPIHTVGNATGTTN